MTETAVSETASDTVDDEPIDWELIEEAARGLGTRGPNTTINAVVREYVERKRADRMAALEWARQMSAEGRFDYSVLEGEDE